MGTILYSGRDVSVVAQAGTSRKDTLVVTFFVALRMEEVSKQEELDKAGYGAATLYELGVHQVHFIANWWHGWQSPEVRDALAAAKAHVAGSGASRVIVIGPSLGGYGALLFASEFGADAVFTVAPLYTIDIRIAGFDPRSQVPKFAQAAGMLLHYCDSEGRLPHDDMSATLMSAAPKFLLFDPGHASDAAHVAQMRGNNIHRFPIPVVGHQVTRYLRETDTFLPVLKAVLEGDVPAVAAALSLARRRRRQSALFLEAFSFRLVHSRRHRALARRVVGALARRSPDHLVLRCNFVTLLLAHGRQEKARAELEVLEQAWPDERRVLELRKWLAQQAAGGARTGAN